MGQREQKSKKQKRSRAGTGSYLRYRNENRKLKNKATKLARRFSHYKKQPPAALRGIIDNALRALVMKKIEKLRLARAA